MIYALILSPTPYLFCLLLQGRSNLPPEKVPWDALKALLRMSIYGGRIDNEFDQRLMDSFIDKVSVVALSLKPPTTLKHLAPPPPHQR